MDFLRFVFDLNKFLLYSKSFIGDRKHLNEAKTQVQHFYKDLTITIDDISE